MLSSISFHLVLGVPLLQRTSLFGNFHGQQSVRSNISLAYNTAEVIHYIANAEIPCISYQVDRFIWLPDPHGYLSTASACAAIRIPSPTIPQQHLLNNIWKVGGTFESFFSTSPSHTQPAAT